MTTGMSRVAGSLVLAHQRAVSLDEWLEQPGNERRVDPRAFVADPEPDRAGDRFRSDLDRGVLRAELHRVREQVEQHLPELSAVREHRGRWRRGLADLDALALRLRLHQRDRVVDRGLRQDRLEAQLDAARLDLRQVEDVVDQG